MTQIRTLTAFALVVAAFVGLGALLLSQTGQQPAELTTQAKAAVLLAEIEAMQAEQQPALVEAATAVEVPQVEQTSALGTDFGIVQLALGDADYTPEQVTEIIYAADRVCEGQTALVPVPVMVDSLVAEQGLDAVTAQAFVDMALATRC